MILSLPVTVDSAASNDTTTAYRHR